MYRKIRGKKILIAVSVLLGCCFIFEGFKIHNRINMNINNDGVGVDYIDGVGQSPATVLILDDKFVSRT
jgi:hypothetical protein